MRERKFGKNLKDVNMKKLFRRNQIIITSLAVMIAVAGYLNYAGKQELEASSENLAYEAGMMDISDADILAENQAAGVLEEAIPILDYPTAEYASIPDDSENVAAAEYQMGETLAEIESWDEGEEVGLNNPGEAVLTSGMTVADYIATVQLNREQIRAKNKETLNSIINNTNIEEAAKQEAIQNMIAMTAVAEKENAAETLLQAKGFADPVVSMSDGKVDVVINAASITDQQRAQIEDIVKRKTEVSADGIVITLLNLEE
ncbi:MAG: SpoIIIAH-like family protein [Brotaphodocola sp.]